LTIEYLTDTSRAIWTMIKDSGSASDVAARYSNIRFIWSHAGGTLLGLVGRFLGADSFAENLQRVAAPNSRLYHLRRFYYDTASSFSPVQMQALKMLVGHGQILFGSDFPMIPVPVMRRGLEGCGFDAGELRDVYRHNALSLLPRGK
jgi:predicted TIM-barrel fold metal-dependent hydrolase